MQDKSQYPFISYRRESYSETEMARRVKEHYAWMSSRRTVRDFSDKPVPREVIETLVMTASSAPSGANRQPWTFCAVADPVLKRKIRIAAEKEEYENYNGRMPEDWLEALAPLQTSWEKPFLEKAPWLIIVFRKNYELAGNRKLHNYYISESVGLACGFLIQAIHHAGLVAVTHTPSPMDFLGKILQRPANEKAFLLIPVGYPGDEARVPDIRRKPSEEVLHFYE